MYNAWVGTVFNSRCDSIYEAPTTLADDFDNIRLSITAKVQGDRAFPWPRIINPCNILAGATRETSHADHH